MSPSKITTYFLLIAFIILAILISMLDFNKPDELLIARWSIFGILSLFVISTTLVDFTIFKNIQNYSFSWVTAVKVLLTPLLVIVLAATILVLVDKEDFFELIFLKPPFEPVSLLIISSIATHIVLAVLKNILSGTDRGRE